MLIVQNAINRNFPLLFYVAVYENFEPAKCHHKNYKLNQTKCFSSEFSRSKAGFFFKSFGEMKVGFEAQFR